MAKRVYIYILEKDKPEINKLRQTYHVSLSTLADTFANKYMFYKEMQDQMESYIIKGGTYTSIRPKNDVHNFKENINIIYTNAIHIFINKLDKNILKENSYKAVREVINKELQSKREQFWQYNEQIRNQRRMLKENKEYWKKAVESL